MTKRRTGADALESLIPTTPSTSPAPRPASKARGRKKVEDPREAEIRVGVRLQRLPKEQRGKRQAFYNYYEAADGTLIQKVPAYMPIALVDKLKMRAIKERRTISELIRRAVVEYLGK